MNEINMKIKQKPQLMMETKNGSYPNLSTLNTISKILDIKIAITDIIGIIFLKNSIFSLWYTFNKSESVKFKKTLESIFIFYDLIYISKIKDYFR